MYVISQNSLELSKVRHLGVVPPEAEGGPFRVLNALPEEKVNMQVAEYRTHEAAIEAFYGLVRAIERGAMVFEFPKDREPDRVLVQEPTQEPVRRPRARKQKSGGDA